MVTLVRALCVLMILSGIGGVAVSDQSAGAGWWLIVVFSGLLVLTYVARGSGTPSTDQPSSRAVRFRPITAGLVIVAIIVVVPVAVVMLLGGT